MLQAALPEGLVLKATLLVELLPKTTLLNRLVPEPAPPERSVLSQPLGTGWLGKEPLVLQRTNGERLKGGRLRRNRWLEDPLMRIRRERGWGLERLPKGPALMTDRPAAGFAAPAL